MQEIVDRAGWASGNALALITQADADGSRDFFPHLYDSSAAVAPKLVVTYTTATPPAEVFESRGG